MSEKRHPSIVRVSELPAIESEHGTRFASRRRQAGKAAGAKELGASFYEVPPGKTAFPAHIHYGNEEAIYVLAGFGRLRLGDESFAIAAGDYIALPAGGPAHQLTNDSDATLSYLCISTMQAPDIMSYPDSQKIGLFAGSPPGGPRELRTLAKFQRDTEALDYYAGEDGGDPAE